MLERVMSEVKQSHGLSVRMTDVLACMDEGKQILERCRSSQENDVMAQAALDMVSIAGRACTGTTIGILAKKNAKGQLSSSRVASLTKMSSSHVKANRLLVESNKVGTFGSMTKSRHRYVLKTDTSPKKRVTLSAQRIPLSEVNATRDWMKKTNPARSGDKKSICWMVQTKTEFYHETYRTPKSQIHIIQIALKSQASLRKEAKTRSNKWLRNVDTYCGNYILTSFPLLVCCSLHPPVCRLIKVCV